MKSFSLGYGIVSKLQKKHISLEGDYWLMWQKRDQKCCPTCPFKKNDKRNLFVLGVAIAAY